MEIRFVRAVQFTCLLKAGGRLREFNFRKMKGPEGELFSINVCDDRGERILFQMQKEQNGWKFRQQQLPAWIVQQETKLHEAIEEELQRS
jgi:hypothetical protein